MKRILASKYLWVAVITLGLQIPLSMIESQIEDRTQQRDYAKDSIRKSWTGEQELLASLLVIPYEEKIKVNNYINNIQVQADKESYKWVKRLMYLEPEFIHASAQLNNQSLKKGIYAVPVYTASINIKGAFELADYHRLKKDKNIRFVETAFISMGVKDSRGIVGQPSISIAAEKIKVVAGSQLSFYASGYHGQLSSQQLDSELLNFSSELQLKGMEQLAFVATGKDNRVKATSDWPHPAFDGAFLPISREISDQGYSAEWQTGMFSTNIQSILKDCFENNCGGFYGASFGVRHIQAVDIYLQSLRSVKYGLLVIIATFSIFALYEILSKKINLHPIAYVLTGAALAIFFLLLIALSEHLSFSIAYSVSSVACAGLIGFYVASQSESRTYGIALFSVLIVLYSTLFFIIRSEDHALLSGTLLLFLLLSVIMFVTRKINWYGLTNLDKNSLDKKTTTQD